MLLVFHCDLFVDILAAFVSAIFCSCALWQYSKWLDMPLKGQTRLMVFSSKKPWFESRSKYCGIYIVRKDKPLLCYKFGTHGGGLVVLLLQSTIAQLTSLVEGEPRFEQPTELSEEPGLVAIAVA